MSKRPAVDTTEHDQLRRERYALRAGLYGLILRSRGLTPEDAAVLVAEQFPRLSWHLASHFPAVEPVEVKDYE